MNTRKRMLMVLGVAALSWIAVWSLNTVFAQPDFETKQARLDFALKAFTQESHDVILQDATAVNYLYPKVASAVIEKQGQGEAAYIASLPAWSPLKATFEGWEAFVAEYD